ncbi:hypothetical protein CHS0354_008777 [Potamilus streckersoni]|uniref:Uncharacterized protein n=1 Tax=Potamilus streckersoni TaxID=2493646 RepID=A0AAE0SPD7_9BIVA|nr:hypothetical protein CHS0354_008777 [Potamilus streckersoni]
MRNVIKNLKVFFAQNDISSKDCLCTGYVAYNINRTEQSSLETCTRQDRMSAEANNVLFQNGNIVGPCAYHHLVWHLIGSVPTNLSGSLDCQWEILKHYNGILDIQGSQCTCKNGAHEKRFIFEQTQDSIIINLNPFWHSTFVESNNNGNNNNNNGKNENQLITDSSVPTVHENPFQGCGIYKEYNDLLHLKGAHECHTVDHVLATLHALHEHPHGAQCMRNVIENLKVFFAHNISSKDCLCTGYVAYNINRTEQNSLKTCTHQDRMSAEANNILFQNGNSVGPCAYHHLVWHLIGSVPTNLSGSLDCQWEILKHYNGILDIRGSQCTCKNVTYECTKALTIGILAYGLKQANTEAGDCQPGSKDHVASEALVINMCNTLEPHNWKEGQHVMSVCDSVPLYTPVATFFDGKYSSQGGLAGIFVGCLENGFKMIVQECDRNITVIHITTGGHFLMDPRSYSIVN